MNASPWLYIAEKILFNGYWGHTGIYYGGERNEVVESYPDWFWPVETPGVVTRTITSSGFWEAKDWVILRPETQYNHGKMEEAASYAADQVGHHYNWRIDDKWRTDKFYCTQLVWRAYNSGSNPIDLDSDIPCWLPCFVLDNPDLCSRCQAVVWPDDIYHSPYLTIVRSREDLQRAAFYLGSSADFYVTDPFGRHAGVDPLTGQVVNEMPDEVFYSGPDTEPQVVAIRNMEGTWSVGIVGKETGEYILGTEVVDRDNHQTETISKSISDGQVVEYLVTYPQTPDRPIGVTHKIYLPLILKNYSIPTPTPVVECYCCSPGDSIYRIDDSSFYGYQTYSASDSPLIRVTSPPAPLGWNQPDFVPDSSWQPASEVWWALWDDPPWVPLPGDCRPIGLRDEDGNQEAQSGTTHLYRRAFTLFPPQPDMQVTQAVLEMWSDSKTEWWWEGTSISYDRQAYVGQVDLFPARVGPHGGTYVLAVQNSNDYVCSPNCNPQGTACRLCVTWAVPPVTPTPTRTPTPTHTPTRTPTPQGITNLRMSDSCDGPDMILFPAGTETVYVVFDYSGMQGEMYRIVVADSVTLYDADHSYTGSGTECIDVTHISDPIPPDTYGTTIYAGMYPIKTKLWHVRPGGPGEITNLHMSISPDGPPQTEFIEGTQTVWAIFDYADMEGNEVGIDAYEADSHFYESARVPLTGSGTKAVSITHYQVNGFPVGQYRTHVVKDGFVDGIVDWSVTPP